MVNILVITEDMSYCKKLINSIVAEIENVKICGIASNIKEIIFTISKHQIDIILMDFNLSKIQSILEKKAINTKLYKESIILIYDKENISKNIKLNPFVCECIQKNMSFRNIVNSINSMISRKNCEHIYDELDFSKCEVIRRFEDELSYLGYNKFHKGTKYMVDAIYILYTFKDYYTSDLERDVYPIIAKKYNKTINNIKCNIINATTVMYYECEEEKLLSYLKEVTLQKPGPKKVIIAVLDKIYGNTN